jgi:hypothetical protein
MKSIVGLLVFSAVFALPAHDAFAQDSHTTVIVPSVTPVTADSSPATIENEKMVCHASRPMMGTHFSGPRICKTQRQWNAEHHEAQRNLEKDQSRGCLSSGDCPK